MRCGYEVPRMILLKAHLCTYSLLSGVNFEVHPLRNYALSPTMLPLLETFFEQLPVPSSLFFFFFFVFFWMSSITRTLRPFKADLIFGNSHKSFGAKSGEYSNRFLGQKLFDR